MTPTTKSGRALLTPDRMAKALHATAPRNHPPAPLLRSICQGHEPHLNQARQMLDILAIEQEARADEAESLRAEIARLDALLGMFATPAAPVAASEQCGWMSFTGVRCPFNEREHSDFLSHQYTAPAAPAEDAECLTSCGCDGRRVASECSGPYPPDSPVDGCRRCRR
jgi:hypothetical protein